MNRRRLNVLFLCTSNSARSIMAEALLNRSGRGRGRWRGLSAGTDPKGFVHLEALSLLRRLRFETARLRSKDWTEFAHTGAPDLDLVITLCDGAAHRTAPEWPGNAMTAHWGVPDPVIDGTAVDVSHAFASAFQLLRERISAFTNLPFARLDDLALRGRLREIGALRAAPPANLGTPHDATPV